MEDYYRYMQDHKAAAWDQLQDRLTSHNEQRPKLVDGGGDESNIYNENTDAGLRGHDEALYDWLLELEEVVS